jgi:uncharacterized protein (TIGR03382 family)
MERRRRARAWLYLAIASALIARGSDAGVVFSDDFESDVATIKSRWGDSTSTGISQSSDVPGASTGRKSLLLTAGTDQTALLYHRLPVNYDKLYYRYYVKYEGTTYHHTGAMIGGYQPPSDWPQGDAGLKGVRANGDRLVVASLETQSNYRFDTYNNWIDMQGGTYQGLYFGRNLFGDLNLPIPSQWSCVELMISMNSPATASNGELVNWIDGNEIANFHAGAPNGYWDGEGNWRMRSGSPAFGGFRWRDTTALGLNWVKIQNYDATPRVWFDDLVVSTQRVGCLPEPGAAGSLAAGVVLLAALGRRRPASARARSPRRSTR